MSRFTPYAENYREKSLDKIKREIKTLQKFKKPIYFCDNIMNANPQRFLQLCRILAKFKIGWAGELFPRISALEAKWMKKSKCRFVALGIESMCDSVLKKLNKPLKLTTILQTLKNLKENSIHIHAMFFFGFPTETFLEALLSAIRIIKYSYLFDSVVIVSFILTRGSIIEKFPQKFRIKKLKPLPQHIFMNAMPYKPRKPYLTWLWDFLRKYLEDKILEIKVI